jgi:aspartate aminotransferase
MNAASRFASIEISLIRQINALGTPLSINLGIGEPNIEPDEFLRDLARRAAHASWHYSPIAGLLELRRHIARAAGGGFDPKDEVCVTAGTGEALFAIVQAWIDPGEQVLVPDPGFLAYPVLVRLAGAIPVPYPLEPDGWHLDPKRLARLVTPKTKMIILNSPSNPTGATIDEATLDAIAHLADERDLLVVADEVYREIHFGALPPTMLGRSRNAIVVSGLSKSHAMTGLRLGWAIARADLMAPIIKAHQYIATCASVLSQAIAISIFDAAEWNAGWLERLRSTFEVQRSAAVGAVERELAVKIAPPAGAFYLFTPVPTGDTVSLAKALATEAAVLTIPGIAFGKGGEGFLRISYAASPETLTRGIECIGRYLREIESATTRRARSSE